MTRRGRALVVALAMIVPMAVRADTVDLVAIKDNTLYESGSGDVSNGAGNYFFVGMTNSLALRRGVLAFDIAGSVPAGSTINSVTLTLFMSRTTASTHSVNVHRLLADWGEGNSAPGGSEGGGAPSASGDATWIHRFYDGQFWSSSGGDYTGISSAVAAVGGIGTYNWSSAGMRSDVQLWLDSPASDFGWLLRGNESASDNTAKRFNSRQIGTASQRPRLAIDYTPPVVDGACCTVNDSCSIDDQTGCELGGGVFHGVGTSCSPNPCVLPTGACCYADGGCAELPTSSCAATGGMDQGGGTTCAPGTCPEPIGACCADAGTCSIETESDCATQDGTFQGGGTVCIDAECPVILEPFVDALPLPPVMQPTTGTAGGTATYDMAMEQFEQQLHRDLPPTTLWGYEGMYPGPTIEATSGQTVTVNWYNDLRDSMGALRTDHYLPVDLCPHGPNFEGPTARTVVHLHGAHVEEEFDGYPEDTILPGEQQTFIYSNYQLPATLWYHDHALGITRLNVYLGLAGFYLIRDAVELALPLPSGPYEVPLVVQDRKFNADGSLDYPAEWVDHFFGDTILVNGKVWPYLDVDQGKYRFRLLNGSGSRTYTFSLGGGLQFQQIGTDGGLLPAPVTLSEITLGPAERADVIVDFDGLSPGTEILLTNSATAPFPDAAGTGVIPNVMKFVVTSQSGYTAAVPASLRPLEALDDADAVAARDFEMFVIPDSCTGSRWTINGLMWDDITEYPLLDTIETWRFINRSGMMHPMHMHLVMFQVLDRQPFDMIGGVPTPIGPAVPPPPNEAGWKDTVQVLPGEMTRVIARFERYTGKFAYHCHILEHEDNEMMRQFQTIECGDGQIDPTEDCDDGNAIDLDGCSRFCKTEDFMVLEGVSQTGTIQINVDGITFYALAFSGQTAAQVIAGLANDLNNNSTLAARGVTAEAIDGVLVVYSGPLSVTNISDPGFNSLLSLRMSRGGVWWARVEGASDSDVVRGDINTLRAGGFTPATLECAAPNTPDAYLQITGNPVAGQGDWYLVRSGSVSYDTGSPSQTASRNAPIAASGNDCP